MFSLFKKKPSGSEAATLDTKACIDDLTNKVKAQLDSLSQSMSSPTAKTLAEIDTAFSYVSRATEAIISLGRVVQNVPLSKDVKRNAYCVSSRDLHRARAKLTSYEGKESLIFITGPVTDDGTRVLSSLLPVKMSAQTPVYVQADANATATLLDTLTVEDGHELFGMWHNHLLTGKDGTRPSQTDLKNQRRMVSFGMPNVLGGIFSADGFVRIFTTDAPFDLTVYGKGVAVIEDSPREKVLKLELKEDNDVSSAPH